MHVVMKKTSRIQSKAKSYFKNDANFVQIDKLKQCIQPYKVKE